MQFYVKSLLTVLKLPSKKHPSSSFNMQFITDYRRRLFYWHWESNEMHVACFTNAFANTQFVNRNSNSILQAMVIWNCIPYFVTHNKERKTTKLGDRSSILFKVQASWILHIPGDMVQYTLNTLAY